MNSGIKTAKILVGIPLGAFIAEGICFLLSMILEKPTDRGTVYTLLAAAWLLGLFVFPLPCLAMSSVGTVLAVKAKKQNEPGASGALILGIIELLFAAISIVLAVLFLIGAMSV